MSSSWANDNPEPNLLDEKLRDWIREALEEEPDYIQQLETDLDRAETKLARIELILNDPTIDPEDVAHAIWGLFND